MPAIMDEVAYLADLRVANTLTSTAQIAWRAGDYPLALARLDAVISELKMHPRAFGMLQRALEIRTMIEKSADPK